MKKNLQNDLLVQGTISLDCSLLKAGQDLLSVTLKFLIERFNEQKPH